MTKTFLILADLDSTFEEYNPDSDEFASMLNFINKFEKELNCFIAIHFISGTSKEDLADRLDFFHVEYPDIYNRIYYAVLGGGKKYSRELSPLGKCGTDYAPYSKADGVSDILSNYRQNEIAGACFIGEGKNDIPGFEMIKYYKNKFDYGTFCLSPRSRRDYDDIISYVDFYSSKPRILGCVDCLNQMHEAILDKIKDENSSSL